MLKIHPDRRHLTDETGRTVYLIGDTAWELFHCMSREEVLDRYRDHMKMDGRIPDVLADAMGNQFYIATFDTEEEMKDFYKTVQIRKGLPH